MSLSLKWHLTGTNPVAFHSTEISIPINWWLNSQQEDSLELIRVPDANDEFSYPIYILGKEIKEDSPEKFKPGKIIEDTILEKKTHCQAPAIGDEHTFCVEYEVVSPPQKRGNLYWTLVIPKRKLIIQAIEINANQKEQLIKEILGRIRFLPDTKSILIQSGKSLT